jgi:hypothetical protein
MYIYYLFLRLPFLFVYFLTNKLLLFLYDYTSIECSNSFWITEISFFAFDFVIIIWVST